MKDLLYQLYFATSRSSFRMEYPLRTAVTLFSWSCWFSTLRWPHLQSFCAYGFVLQIIRSTTTCIMSLMCFHRASWHLQIKSCTTCTQVQSSAEGGLGRTSAIMTMIMITDDLGTVQCVSNGDLITTHGGQSKLDWIQRGGNVADVLIVKIKPAGVRNRPSIILCDFHVNPNQRGLPIIDFPHNMPVTDPLVTGVLLIVLIFYLLNYCYNSFKGRECDMHKLIETLELIVAQI